MNTQTHSLWYTSSRAPLIPSYLDHHSPSLIRPNGPAVAGGGLRIGGAGATAENTGPSRTAATATANHAPAVAASTHHPNNLSSAANAASIIDRSFLGRLRADEAYLERRRANIANMGSTWLKPPGMPKTLFQIREERREAEEHAEAVRREMLAAELAAANEEEDGEDVMDEGEEEEEEEEARDLDEEIPDADEGGGGFGFDGASDEEEEEEAESSEEEEEEDDESSSSEEEVGDISLTEARRERREMANRMASIRATEERMRGLMAAQQQQQQQQHQFQQNGIGEEEEIDEGDPHGLQDNMLEEEDLVNHSGMGEGDLDMDADLDDEIPEGQELSGFGDGDGYEHTDSEVSLSSDEGTHTQHNMSYASQSHRRSSGIRQNQHRRRSSLMRGNNPRSSLDISGFLSRDGSSILGSSPQVGRRTSRQL